MKLKAFTLVELLVVMAIISFLSVGAFAGLTFGLRQARDTQRKKLVDLANTSLQAYYSDYSTYPKTALAGCAAGNTVTGATNWYYCSNAFPTDATGSGTFITGTAKTGIKDYLEGEWPISNTSNPGSGNNQLRYYYYASSTAAAPVKFAVCISLENKNGGNVTRDVSGVTMKDCYCIGADYAALKCTGLASIAN